jgi:hypothetical protein
MSAYTEPTNDPGQTRIEGAAGKVIVAHPQPDHISAFFSNSMAYIMRYDATHRNLIASYRPIFSGANVAHARNDSVRWFLDNTDADWLWFIDADMVMDGSDGRVGINVLDLMMDVADPETHPIVGALCFSWTLKDCMPTLFQIHHSGNVLRWHDYPPDALIPAMTGTGCILIHRKVFEAVRAQGHPRPFEWFEELSYNGDRVGEDITFCLRAVEAGFRPVVHTGLVVGHHKSIVVDHNAHREFGQKAVLRKDPKWTPRRPLHVVIPFKDKPELTLRTLSQLGDVDSLLLIDNGSSMETLDMLEGALPEGAKVVQAPGEGIHEMWNRGIEHALALVPEGDFDLAVLNNDVDFMPGALRECQRVMLMKPGVAVVCPNYDGRFNADHPFDDVQRVDDICANRYDGTGGLAGFAFLVRGEFLANGYRFPTDMKWWYGDNDLVMSAMTTGSWSGIALQAHCRHIDGGSKTAGDWSRFAEQTEADRKVFEAKWGVETVQVQAA